LGFPSQFNIAELAGIFPLTKCVAWLYIRPMKRRRPARLARSRPGRRLFAAPAAGKSSPKMCLPPGKLGQKPAADQPLWVSPNQTESDLIKPNQGEI
jgi:hypothetical protein